MRTAIALRFDEPETYQLPADGAENMAPFSAPAGLTKPATADGIVGGAREWTGALQGLSALEAVTDAAALRRDCTIEAVCKLPWLTTNGTYRLITRGKGTSTAERELWGLQVVVSGAPSAPAVSLQMRWQRASAAAATVTAMVFVPPPGYWWYLAASRRWVSETECEVSYYCNGLPLGVVTSAHGDIQDGSGGTVLVGCETVGPSGMPTGSVIDEIRVSNEVRSAEEIEWTYKSLFVFGLYGYEMIRALLPPGDAYSHDPDSAIQRELMVTGDGLGTVLAKANEIHEYLLPDRAWSFLDRWETVTRLAPLPTDSFATRRARVTAFMRKVQGFTWAQISEVLAPLLDCAAADLTLLEYGSQILETFAASSARWIRDAGDATSITIAAGVATFVAAASDNLTWTAYDHGASIMKTNLYDASGAEVIASISPTTLPASAAVGVFVYDQVGRGFDFFGILNDAGTNKWFHRACNGTTVTDTIGAATGAGTVFWMRWYDRDDGTADLGFRVDGAGFDGPWTAAWSAVASTTAGRYWTGVACLSTAVLAGALSVTALDFRARTPNWGGVFAWYVFRAVALGGTPDMKGARRLLEKMKPAHTQGSVIESTSLLFDTATDQFDRDPLGV